jgi:hypothetical protein
MQETTKLLKEFQNIDDTLKHKKMIYNSQRKIQMTSNARFGRFVLIKI